MNKRIMAIDGGAENGTTSIFFNDYSGTPRINGEFAFKNGRYTISCPSKSWKEQIAFTRNWIDRLQVNYIIYEGRPSGVEEIHQRESMQTMYIIYSTIVRYCQKMKIAGCRISPQELIDYREEKGYLKSKMTETEWIRLKGLKRSDGTDLGPSELPKDGKEEAKKEGHEIGLDNDRHELDATCLGEYGAEKNGLKGDGPSCFCKASKLSDDKHRENGFNSYKTDYLKCAKCGLEKREKLHWQEPAKNDIPDNTRVDNHTDAYNRRQYYKNLNKK